MILHFLYFPLLKWTFAENGQKFLQPKNRSNSARKALFAILSIRFWSSLRGQFFDICLNAQLLKKVHFFPKMIKFGHVQKGGGLENILQGYPCNFGHFQIWDLRIIRIRKKFQNTPSPPQKNYQKSVSNKGIKWLSEQIPSYKVTIFKAIWNS